MNPLKKAYCRVFQNVFKFALPLLPYRNPKIIGSVKGIPEVLEKRNYNNVLIITDAGIRSLGLTERLEQTLKRSCISYHIYDKTVANPTTVNVDEALHMYLDNDCQAIIGFGGGSSMDCAKATAARIAKPHQSLAQMKSFLFSSPSPRLQEQEVKQHLLLSLPMQKHGTNMPSTIFR